MCQFKSILCQKLTDFFFIEEYHFKGTFYGITFLSQELYFFLPKNGLYLFSPRNCTSFFLKMVSAYSLPGTVLPEKKLEIGEYAVACLVPFKCDIWDVILSQNYNLYWGMIFSNWNSNNSILELRTSIFEESWNIKKCFHIAHTGEKKNLSL